MATVETVRGPVDTADLGRTYMHEHVFVLNPDVQQNYPDDWGSEEDRVDDAVVKLKALAAQGIRTIADPTVVGLGRYIPRIQRIAEQVPELNIIARHRLLHLRPGAVLLLLPGPGPVGGAGGRGARPDGRHVHQRHHRRHRRTPGSRPPFSSAPSTTRA